MDEKKKAIQFDVDGFDTITAAIRSLLNLYPGLPDGDEITFSTLNEDGGKAMYPLNGAVISKETMDVTGHVTQECSYLFSVVYRAAGLSESRKAAVKEWLEDLGRWLEGQEITVGGEVYELEDYPSAGPRNITNIKRATQAFLDSVEENKAENWVISINAQYTNEYDTDEWIF